MGDSDGGPSLIMEPDKAMDQLVLTLSRREFYLAVPEGERRQIWPARGRDLNSINKPQ